MFDKGLLVINESGEHIEHAHVTPYSAVYDHRIKNAKGATYSQPKYLSARCYCPLERGLEFGFDDKSYQKIEA